MIPRSDPPLSTLIVAILATSGPTTSSQLQAQTHKSQATLSRAIQTLGRQVLTLGQGKKTRYGLAQTIRGLPAQQPLWRTNAQGQTERLGTLSFLSGDWLHVQAQGAEYLMRGQLLWFLAPLRMQGFLGRAWAHQLGLDSDPERWSLEEVLTAALHCTDPIGAITLGESGIKNSAADSVQRIVGDAHYDTIAQNVSLTLPAGSSAGGEQSKFLSCSPHGAPVLVKFSPPRGTPFGERWHDLLHAEALALKVLSDHGIAVATTRIVETPQRTYLESIRFDCIGERARGRRHVVSLDAIHQHFIDGPRQNWAASCDALVTQKRLPANQAAMVRVIYDFGHLIGNSDMHFGNLSLWVPGTEQTKFALAPVYDMLPMRWRPDGFLGLHDYSPFGQDREVRQSAAGLPDPKAMARVFWQRLGGGNAVSKDMCEVAQEMAGRIHPGAA
jgi:hypothetical protein